MLDSERTAEQITRWVELSAKVAQVAPLEIQPKESGIRKASRELGIDRTEVQRAVKISKITAESKVSAA